MRRDDITSLLARQSGSEFGFHSGRVLSWDSETGANTVDVAGAVLTDVPILNTSEAIALAADDIVGMLRFQHSYFILGRITIPRTEQFASAALDFVSIQDDNVNFFVPGDAPAVRTSVVFDVPAWATEAAVVASLSTNFDNDGAATTAWAYPRIPGGAVGGIPEVALGAAGNVGEHGSVSSALNVVGAPGATITVEGVCQAGHAIAASFGNAMYLSAFAVFRAA